jgi:DNA-binding NarL/FixJ family response regulator
MTSRYARSVTSWARKAREALDRRNEAIVAMRADGATLQAIADAADLSHVAVRKIVMRQQEDPTTPA